MHRGFKSTCIDSSISKVAKHRFKNPFLNLASTLTFPWCNNHLLPGTVKANFISAKRRKRTPQLNGITLTNDN